MESNFNWKNSFVRIFQDWEWKTFGHSAKILTSRLKMLSRWPFWRKQFFLELKYFSSCFRTFTEFFWNIRNAFDRVVWTSVQVSTRTISVEFLFWEQKSRLIVSGLWTPLFGTFAKFLGSVVNSAGFPVEQVAETSFFRNQKQICVQFRKLDFFGILCEVFPWRVKVLQYTCTENHFWGISFSKNTCFYLLTLLLSNRNCWTFSKVLLQGGQKIILTVQKNNLKKAIF